MKKLLLAMLTATGLLLGACSKEDKKADQTVTVYMYSEYIDPEMLKEFEAQTGVKVRLDVYESPEEMLAKIEQAGGKYDVVVASDHAVQVLRAKNMLRELDRSKLPNAVNVSEQFADPAYDRGSKYSLPYQWGTVGLIYRKDRVANLEPSWGVIFDPARQPGPVVYIDSTRDLLGAALRYKGYSVNSTDPAEIKAAAEVVLAGKAGKVVGFDGSPNGVKKVLSGDATVAVIYNGDGIREMDENCAFVTPREGTIIWVDAMTIPTSARNPEAAHKFINYVLGAEAGAKLSNFVQFATPNKASLPLVEQQQRENPGIYPPADDVKKMEYLVDLGDGLKLYDEAWTQIKAGR